MIRSPIPAECYNDWVVCHIGVPRVLLACECNEQGGFPITVCCGRRSERACWFPEVHVRSQRRRHKIGFLVHCQWRRSLSEIRNIMRQCVLAAIVTRRRIHDCPWRHLHRMRASGGGDPDMACPQAKYTLKIVGAGHGPDYCDALTVFGRITTLLPSNFHLWLGMKYPRRLLENLQSEDANAAPTPCVKVVPRDPTGEAEFRACEATWFRSVVATNWIACCRADLAWSAKEACRRMSSPQATSGKSFAKLGEPKEPLKVCECSFTRPPATF